MNDIFFGSSENTRVVLFLLSRWDGREHQALLQSLSSTITYKPTKLKFMEHLSPEWRIWQIQRVVGVTFSNGSHPTLSCHADNQQPTVILKTLPWGRSRGGRDVARIHTGLFTRGSKKWFTHPETTTRGSLSDLHLYPSQNPPHTHTQHPTLRDLSEADRRRQLSQNFCACEESLWRACEEKNQRLRAFVFIMCLHLLSPIVIPPSAHKK